MVAVGTDEGSHRERAVRDRGRAQMTAPRLWVWTGGLLLVADELESSPHSHMALQVAVGLQAPVRLLLEGAWVAADAAIVEAGVEHGFDGGGGAHAVLHIDAETVTAQTLRRELLEGRPYRILDEPAAERAGGELAPLLDDAGGCREVRKRFRAALAALAGTEAVDSDPAVDQRLLPVLDRLREIDHPTPPVSELAAMAHLSTSRFQHVFREQMGMPPARYALWQRMYAAARRVAEGASVTRAAHEAGFADSAHFAREFRRFNGQSPTSMGDLADLATFCDDDPRAG